MNRTIIVHPLKHQPQWPSDPMPIRYPWGRGFLAAALLAVAFLALVDSLGAAWLLGGGS